MSCWNANEAVPGTLLTEHDLILSDQLNHASIIDGLRLAKAITKCQTGVYKHADLDDLRAKLAAATRPQGQDGDHRRRLLDGRAPSPSCPTSLAICREARRGAGGGRLPLPPACSGKTGPGHRGALRDGGPGGHHHLHPGQGARRGGGRVRGRHRRGLRLPDAAGAAAALLERAAAHGGGERAGQHPVPRGAPGAGHPTSGERAVLPGPAPRPRLQAAAGRDPDHPGDPGRDRRRHPDERTCCWTRGCS